MHMPTASSIRTARSSALFVTGGGTGPAILELLAYMGWATDVVTCLNLCRDTRSNPNLWMLADTPNGPNDRTRLMFAAATGDVPRLRELLAYPCVDINKRDAKGFTALSWASINGHLAAVCHLMDCGALALLQPRTGDSKYAMSLHAAAAGGHSNVVHELVGRGVDVNARGAGGWTALVIACSSQWPRRGRFVASRRRG